MRLKRERVCEVKVGSSWRTMSLAEAQTDHRDALKRCSACHGRVIINGSYTGKVRLVMMHRRAHDGCPLQPKVYSGIPSPHPDALA